jgi:D-erythro-7,8-dihydroneopterin triphosphate epimerase
MSFHTSLATTKITNLKLDTIIGCNDWERKTTQQIVVNISMDFDATAAIRSDDLGETVDYRALKKKIISSVTSSSFELLETLTAHILSLVMEDQRVLAATVTVDKPKALRFTDSVSITLSAQRNS